jgi:hypothetical protein
VLPGRAERAPVSAQRTAPENVDPTDSPLRFDALFEAAEQQFARVERSPSVLTV